MVETNEQQPSGFLSRLPYYSLIALIASLGFIQVGYPIFGKNAVITDILFLVTAAVWVIAIISRQIELHWDRSYWAVLAFVSALGISLAFA